jgi:hypothetical protein
MESRVGQADGVDSSMILSGPLWPKPGPLLSSGRYGSDGVLDRL